MVLFNAIKNNTNKIFWILIALILAYIYTHGFVPHDEGWIINPAKRLLIGEVVYRDYHFIYFPLSVYLTYLCLSIFDNLIFIRIIAFLITLGTSISLFKLINKLSSSHTLSYLSVVLYIAYLPLTINFLSPTVLAVSILIIGLNLLFDFQKNTRSYYKLAGIVSTLVLISKQNFGLAVILSFLILIFINKSKLLNLKNYLIGFLFGILPFLIILLLNNSIIYFINDIIYFHITKISHQLTPFIYPMPYPYVVFKTIFYLLPFIISILGLFIALKNKEKNIYIYFILGIFLYIFTIRPTTDYLHLVPLLSFSSIVFAAIFIQFKGAIYQKIIYLLIILLCTVGFYTGIFKNYYRWEDPIYKHTNLINRPRAFLAVDNKTKNNLGEFERIVKQYNLEGNYVLIYEYLPLYYYIFNIKNPTKFDYFPAPKNDDFEDIINDLKNKNVNYIITETDLKTRNDSLSKFIIKNYKLNKFNYFYLYRR